VLKAAFSPSTHEDSVALKIPEVNKVISGWCRYYQYTSRATTQFGRVQHQVYWLAAHWLAGKHKISCKSAIMRFRQGPTLGTTAAQLVRHSDFKTRRSGRRLRPFPNPYTSAEALTREKLPEGQNRLIIETRKGSEDRRREIMARDNYTCQWGDCGAKVTLKRGMWTIYVRGVSSAGSRTPTSRRTCGRFVWSITRSRLSLTDRGKAVCIERCMHGLAGGVGKRASAPRPAPTQQEEDAEVAARRIQIRLTGRKGE
jgi:hypothetical protein